MLCTKAVSPDDDWHKDTSGFPGLVRSADFIGQLADPNRMQKCTALFYEFEELGLNQSLGYKTPGDLRNCNAKFYWNSINPYVQQAMKYLKLTQDGKQWIANLQSNVFGENLFLEKDELIKKYVQRYVYANDQFRKDCTPNS